MRARLFFLHLRAPRVHPGDFLVAGIFKNLVHKDSPQITNSEIMVRVRVKTLGAATQQLIADSHNDGNASQPYKASQSRYIQLPGNKMMLILPSGEATLAGK